MLATAACKLRASHERHLAIKVMSRQLSVSVDIEIDLIDILHLSLLTYAYLANKLTGTRLSLTFPTEYTTLLRC